MKRSSNLDKDYTKYKKPEYEICNVDKEDKTVQKQEEIKD